MSKADILRLCKSRAKQMKLEISSLVYDDSPTKEERELVKRLHKEADEFVMKIAKKYKLKLRSYRPVLYLTGQYENVENLNERRTKFNKERNSKLKAINDALLDLEERLVLASSTDDEKKIMKEFLSHISQISGGVSCKKKK